MTPELWTTDYRSVTARTRTEPAFTAITFVTEAEQPGLQVDTVGGAPVPAPTPVPPPPTPPAAGTTTQVAVRTLAATGASTATAVTAAAVVGGAVVARRYLAD